MELRQRLLRIGHGRGPLRAGNARTRGAVLVVELHEHGRGLARALHHGRGGRPGRRRRRG
jgi:hypothetical protein